MAKSYNDLIKISGLEWDGNKEEILHLPTDVDLQCNLDDFKNDEEILNFIENSLSNQYNFTYNHFNSDVEYIKDYKNKSDLELNYNEIKVAYMNNIPKELYNILVQEDFELENPDDGSAQYKIGNVINSVLDEYGKNSQLYQELKNMEKNGIQYIES